MGNRAGGKTGVAALTVGGSVASIVFGLASWLGPTATYSGERGERTSGPAGSVVVDDSGSVAPRHGDRSDGRTVLHRRATLLTQPSIEAVMDTSRHLCSPQAGTTLVPTGEKIVGAPSGWSKFHEVEVADGICARHIGWIVGESLLVR